MHPDTWKAIERRRRANRLKGPMPQPRVVVPKLHTPDCGCQECKPRHGSEAQPCWCDECFNAGQRRADYEKAKRLREEL